MYTASSLLFPAGFSIGYFVEWIILAVTCPLLQVLVALNGLDTLYPQDIAREESMATVDPFLQTGDQGPRTK